jgi:hypothetical protein
MGAVFTQDIAIARWPEFLSWLRAGDGQLVGTSLKATDDYLEAVEEYTKRITAEAKYMRQERRERGVDNAPLTIGACSATGRALDITNKLVIIKADALRAEYRGADHQYFLAESGFGCAANSRGNAVYGRNLYTGEKARWERYDVLGVAAPDNDDILTAKKSAVACGAIGYAPTHVLFLAAQPGIYSARP